jgi:hypothetical protein
MSQRIDNKSLNNNKNNSIKFNPTGEPLRKNCCALLFCRLQKYSTTLIYLCK